VNTGPITRLHAFGRSPFSGQAFVVDGRTKFYYTEDAGDHWQAIASAPANRGVCGGIAFVKTVGHASRTGGDLLDIYYGDECWVYKLVASRRAGKTNFDYGGAWTKLIADHSDARDLAFDNHGVPMLLGTDGGLHHTIDGGAHWTFIGGGHNGYDALQITEIRGQWIDTLSRHDLYFGTQDNDLWSSKDTGATWQDGAKHEGFSIERLFHVPTAPNDVITYIACTPCGEFKSGALFSNATPWPDPPAFVKAPKIIALSFHVQAVKASATLSKGLAVTTNLGVSWQQYAKLADDIDELPRLSWTAPRTTPFSVPALPVLYQAIQTGWDSAKNIQITQLARIVENAATFEGLRHPTGSVSYPAMNGFGGLGINPTMFDWYQVFDVDPSDPNHLIAPDVINEKMMQTFDGGDNWSEIPLLTDLVTNNGLLLFSQCCLKMNIFPLVSAVSFNPDDPEMVALGTWENGIFLSTDGGGTWTNVQNSEQVARITAFDWLSSGDLIISSYGRGLWRVTLQQSNPAPEFAKRSVAAVAKVQAVDHPVGKTQSPMAGKPSVKITTQNLGGDRIAAPGQVIELSASAHRAKEAVEIVLDGEIVERASIGADGTLIAKIISPKEAGIHTLTVRNAVTGKIMGGSMFVVRPEDPREGEEREEKP
jgi:hypothetical protein